ncbi:MAG: DUF5960 family protein [Bacillota bacterium]|nr:DUF5960 family protein [Bacillota bacterium]
MTKADKVQGQISYFSASYQNFEEDFYKYSNFKVPLTFLVDDLVKSMVSREQNYFILNGKNSKDGKDHFFIFSREESQEARVWVFSYKGHKESL